MSRDKSGETILAALGVLILIFLKIIVNYFLLDYALEGVVLIVAHKIVLIPWYASLGAAILCPLNIGMGLALVVFIAQLALG